MLRRSWIEIDLSVIEKNYLTYRSLLPEGQRIMAVVKADAYGHGDTAVATHLSRLGCTDFAVSNIEEAIRLREAGIEGQILILGYTPVSSAEDLVTYDITQALLSEEYAERLAGKGIKAQFALDTGMNRIGLNADDPASCEETIRRFAHAFTLTGLFTHLCVADTESGRAFTEHQIALFRAVTERVADLGLPYCHCMNSAGGLMTPSFGCFARLGIILYGLKPDYSNTLPAGIRPALTWKSVISMIKTVEAGETVGYGRAYTAPSPRRIATVPTGYADGYNRMLSQKGKVLIRGKEAPIVGRVCMDQMMVDVTEIPEAAFEDEVILIGEGYTADDMARDIGTIGYEVVCGISKRVPRRYC